MDRIIQVKVNGPHLSKDSELAGVRFEGNATKLRIEFDDLWAGLAKRVTFWNALGENPVVILLGSTNNAGNNVYLVPIPPEAMTEPGRNIFVIDGYQAGVRMRSVGADLKVKDAPYAENAGGSQDPTPSQAEQLLKLIENIQAGGGGNGGGGSGIPGKDGVGIDQIIFKETDVNGGNVYSVLLTDGNSYDLTAPKGDTPERGVDYWTEEDIAAMLEEIDPTITSLKVTEGSTATTLIASLENGGSHKIVTTFNSDGKATNISVNGHNVSVTWG